MKRFVIVFLTLATLLCATAPHALAIGFGLYGMGGLGSADWSDDHLPKFGTETGRKAIGISLDTSLSGQHIFNYHLNIGRETFTSKNFVARRDTIPSNQTKGDLELEGMVMSHTFGFGGAVSDSVRMWMGPEIRWHWVKGTPAASPNFDIDGAGFGWGASLGANFNFSSSFTLMVRAGYIMQRYLLDGSGYVKAGAPYSSNSYNVDEQFTYLSLEFLFRSPGDK